MCTDVQSRPDLYLNSDHFLVELEFSMRLKAQRRPPASLAKQFAKPSPQQFLANNERVSTAFNTTGDGTALNVCLLEAANLTLSLMTPTKRRSYLSRHTWGLIEERQRQFTAGDHDRVGELSHYIKNSARADRRRSIANNFREDDADRQHRKLWKVVGQLRKDCKPTYVAMKDTQGHLVPLKKKAEAIADYLESKHWLNSYGTGPLEFTDQIGGPIFCNEDPFTLPELTKVLKAAKLRKQPGPDNMIMELYKWLDHGNRLKLSSILNTWWLEGAPEELFTARVVPIYKKGKIDEPTNYRPISLLNSLYKIYATLFRHRMQQAVESKVSSNPYGFRPNRSTAHAAYIIRRVQDSSEQKSAELHLALLDREKAFDKVQHDTLFESLRRLGFSLKYLQVIRNIYSNPAVFVRDEYGLSGLKRQATGIRQGSSLSPYLFLFVMTCIDHDV